MMRLNSKIMTVVLAFVYSAFLGLLYILDTEAKLTNKGEIMSVIAALSLGELKKNPLLENLGKDASFRVRYQSTVESFIPGKLVIDISQKRVSTLVAMANGDGYVWVDGEFPKIMETENQYFIALSMTGFFLLSLFFLFFSVMLRKVKNLNSALKEQNSYLENAANIDSLTQCYNRHHFKLNKERYFSVYMKDNLAVTIGILDIDFFKSINDVYGHDVGDVVLKSIANFIQKEIPAGSPGVYRFGGEEFVIILIGLSRSEVDDWLDRLYRTMKKNLLSAIKNKEVTFSIGLTKVTSNDESIEEVLKRADKALYCAKNSGRSQYSWSE